MANVSDNGAATLSAEVIGESPLWAYAGVDETTVQRATDALWSRVAQAPGITEVSVLLTSDERVRALNAQFRGKDQPTNVLSFPSGDDEYIGDIALGVETVTGEAEELGVTLGDHVIHLVIHGTLHLLGYDHETNEDAEEMETMEVLVLKDLGIANPYEGRELSNVNASTETNEGAA